MMIDPELLLKELRRNRRSFSGTIFWRDVREVGTCLALVPAWVYLGMRLSLPWTWYLSGPVLVWMAGYILADGMTHRRSEPSPDEPLRRCVEGSMAEVDRQIRLLRRVFWWYLLPPAVSISAFFVQVAWMARAGGWWTVLGFALLVLVEVVVYSGVYRINQDAVRDELEPRRRELEAVLASLGDEAA